MSFTTRSCPAPSERRAVRMPSRQGATGTQVPCTSCCKRTAVQSVRWFGKWMVWPLRLFRINMILSPGRYTDALAFKVTAPVLSERGGVVGVTLGVGMALVVLTGEGMAVDGVVEPVGPVVSYGPQPASNVRTTTAHMCGLSFTNRDVYSLSYVPMC